MARGLVREKAEGAGGGLGGEEARGGPSWGVRWVSCYFVLIHMPDRDPWA